jgi:Ca-activated chloride channel family protein
MKHEPAALLASACGRSMSLQRVDARGRVAGLLLTMTVRQAYRNNTPDTLEVVYTFPLAWGAVLLGLSVEIAGRRLDGTVLARPDAEARYEEAVACGDSPIMVRKGSDQLYTVDLGNLKPGESATIELRYAQLLRMEQGRLRLSVPTTIAPRYGDTLAQPGMRPHDGTAASLSADYGFALSLDVDAAAAAGAIESPSHAIDVLRQDDGGARVSIAGTAWLDRDFVLTLSGVSQASGIAQALRAPDGEGCVVMASFCPALGAPSHAALDLKLLVDCSGSMGGDSIESARRGLERVLAALQPADRLSFSRFGSQVEHVFDAMHAADTRTLERVHRAVGATDATMGGTQMHGALQSTFALPGASGTRGADVLLVTDGQVAGIESVVEAARASRHRIFAVGVGSAPAESLLRQLAEATGGACELVAPGESIEGAMERTFARLRVPRVTGLSMAWGSAPTWTTHTPTALFDGDTLHLFAGFDTVPAGLAPRLSFTLGEGEGATTVALQATVTDARSQDPAATRATDATSADGAGAAHADGATDAAHAVTTAFDLESAPAAVLPRMAAWQRIADMASRRATRGAAQAWARDLALRHGLVTDETNLFLVHVRAEADKATDLPTLQQTQQMLAAGWGGAGSVMARMQSGELVLASMPASYSMHSALEASADGPAIWRSPRGSSSDGLRAFLEDAATPIAPTDRGAARSTPRRLLALARRQLQSSVDVEVLLVALQAATLPEPQTRMLEALATELGLSPDDALLLLLWALARHVADPSLPGDPAMQVLRARLDATVPAAKQAEALARLDATLGATTANAW